MDKYSFCLNILFSAVISPEVIQVIPAIETESQCIALQPQTTEQLSYCLWSTMQDRHLNTTKHSALSPVYTNMYNYVITMLWHTTPEALVGILGSRKPLSECYKCTISFTTPSSLQQAVNMNLSTMHITILYPTFYVNQPISILTLLVWMFTSLMLKWATVISLVLIFNKEITYRYVSLSSTSP